MRRDPDGSQLTARRRDPRIVVGIIYDTASIYITNRSGIANVPGVVIESALTDVSTTSQSLYPDQGRSTIGTMSFTAVDLGSALTDELRDQLLVEGRGVGRREVRVYTGDTDDFTDGTWQRVETYVVDSSVELDGRSYRFSCSDRSREQRVQIFDIKKTTISASVTATDNEVEVLSTDGFELLAHTGSFTDAPNATVGYFRFVKTGEICRYTAKATSPTRFTGVVRGLFGTVAQEVVVESSENEKKPEIEEFVYLEMPGPQLDYAIKTGVILGTSDTLPDAWHMGIDEAYVDSAAYEAIGADLYDPDDDDSGLVLRFTHLDKTDGKRFCEEQLHVPMGTFSPIDAEGVLGIRRVASLLSTAAPVDLLTPASIISHGTVQHALGRVINRIVIQWNYDGESFKRIDVFVNQESIETHGASKPLELKLRGVHVSRHSRQILARIANYIFDRYAAPPIEFEATLSRTRNHLEIADAVRVTLDRLQDFTNVATLNRTFEIQSRRMNWRTGQVQARLFGSTARLQPDVGDGTAPVLPDGWYIATGTALASVLTISGGAVTANGSLTGDVDLRDGVYYYDGDLTINPGVTVTVNENTQLRVKGTLTINGKIDGAGNGIAGLANPDTVSGASAPFPIGPDFRGGSILSGYFGLTRSGDSVAYWNPIFYNLAGWGYRGVNSAAVPRLNVSVEGGELLGVPADLRGAPGGYGPSLQSGALYGGTTVAKGGDGGNGGAGLLIVCRGLSFGVSGQIDLSGGDGTSGASGTMNSVSLYAAGGGGGAPGALYVLLDGDDVTTPDLSTAFLADQGSTPQLGTPGAQADSGLGLSFSTQPGTGLRNGLSGGDHWEAAHFIQYVPADAALGPSDDEIVPAPTNLQASGNDIGVTLTWTSPPAELHDYVEVWRATTNDRTGAVLAFRGRADSYLESSASAVTRYFWVIAAKESAGKSAWSPTGSTAGVVATYGGATSELGWTPAMTGMARTGRRFTKTSGATAWDASVRSTHGLEACRVAFSCDPATGEVMVGLNSDPTTDDSYSSIDYGFVCRDDGGTGYWEIWESGSKVSGVGDQTYSATDLFEVVYDGVFVTYLWRGTVQRRTQRSGAVFYLDSSFNIPGSGVQGLTFEAATRLSQAIITEVHDEFVYLDATELHRRWTKRQGGIADADISLLTGLTDAPGGQAIRFGNNSGNDEWWGALTDILIPYDGVSLYEVGVVARRVTGSGLLYCGLEGVANDRTTMINQIGTNSFGSQHYIAAAGAAPSSSWTTYRGFVRGYATSGFSTPANDSAAPSKMYTGVTFVRPNLIANYNAQAGQMDIAALWVRRHIGALSARDYTRTGDIDEDAATDVYLISNTGTNSGTSSYEDYLSVVVPYDSVVMIEARADGVRDISAGTNTPVWVPFVGGTDGPEFPGQDSDAPPVPPYVLAFASFIVTAGTYNIGCRAVNKGGGTIQVNNRKITITVIKR